MNETQRQILADSLDATIREMQAVRESISTAERLLAIKKDKYAKLC